MFCEKCRSNLQQGVAFCSKCGHPVNNVPQQYGNQPQYAPQFNPYQQMPRKGGIPKIAIILGSVGAVIIILIVVVAVLSSSGGNLESNIVGRWEQTGLLGVLGVQYEFRADNTGTRTALGIPDNFTWSLEDSRITLRTAFWTETYTISISGNTLTFRDGTIPGVHRYTRVR